MSGSYNAAKMQQRFGIPSNSYPKAPRNNSYQKQISGPELADHIFNVYEDDLYPSEKCEDDDGYILEHLTEDTEESGFQFELRLENPNELLENYRARIRKYDRAYAKMSDYALQWYNLMEDVNNNDQLEKMFKDLQMIRKLYGGNV